MPTGGSRSAGRSQSCPRCGAPVLVTPDGKSLDPVPHPLAINLPDGGRLDAVTAAPILTGRAPPIAHHPHAPGAYGCHPEPPLTLF